ncbi:hypothetical protein [Flavobacterium laiguense]|uniref:Uncharacterized protein n=1 Tax=Flavobacterium laiguense TaxID=2169409 RepID=A0A2U1JSX0_9FLAO|nr:hypothetical protein [Flavobacterium laiguense]PWA08296.1 hypothetical protein DB891_11860 [Flavobacterium laiguense]
MEDLSIRKLVIEATEKVIEKDSWLLKNDISEQCISHRLGIYLQEKFAEYNVDCEYNGDIDRMNNKKSISILKENLKEIGLLREREESDLEKEFTKRAVFPDIIIHTRGTNENNLCILEVKKSTSSVKFDYDFLKLKAYTSNFYGNNLKYRIGIFVNAIIDVENPRFEFSYYKEGEHIG